MHLANYQQTKDRAEETLALLEREEKEFRNHWVWKELHCSPEDFFKAVDAHVKSLNISPEKWKETYEKVKQASKIRSMEKRAAYRPVNLKMFAAIRV